ncbi:MAG: (d)CMP kinase [Pseudomonadota bacterium]
MSTLCIVAIDGPAGSGKSTVARAVAAALDFVYVDTGAIYRCVALAAKRSGLALDDGPAVGALASTLTMQFVPDEAEEQRALLGDDDVSQAIRTPAIAMAASAVSALPEVRDALLALQRRLAVDGPRGAVLEGRDIGTVVFPDAGLKIFMIAEVEERARRRLAELQAAGRSITLGDVVQDLNQRDSNDSHRTHAPLRQAADAVCIDTTALSIEQVVERIVELARQRFQPGLGSRT